MNKPRKLSFKETKELADLPDRIDALERDREAAYASLADPALLRDGAAVTAARARLAALETEISGLTARWETLETVASEGG
jgi:ATP-binding cassette subfamily F protein uup